MKILSKEFAVRLCALAFHMLLSGVEEGCLESRFDLAGKLFYKFAGDSVMIVRRDFDFVVISRP